MKRTELEKKLHSLGWYLKRHGGNHDIWTNGEVFEPVPRHFEIVEMLAKKILKKLNEIQVRRKRRVWNLRVSLKKTESHLFGWRK